MPKKDDRERRYRIYRDFHDKKIGVKQAEAQFRDLGLEQWEIDLYLYNDQTGPGDDE
jgi:hypothetical protein